MTKTALKIFLDILEQVEDDLSNNSCNDYTLKNTPENRKFVEDMWNVTRKGERNELPPEGKKEICILDWEIITYLREILKGKDK